ncbi:MAG TPA: vWA domain-containing protein [Gaiellaceae bacterium]
MGLSFLTPVAALFGLLATIPLAMFVGRRRRVERVRVVLGLAGSGRRSWLSLAACLGAVPLLVGVAAAQPVVTSARTVPQRSDAEVFVVIDTSRSMLASVASGEPTRFERAQQDALALQEELPDIPLGVASMTDRVLPHLFPTVDQRSYRETLTEAIGIERPPPSTSFGTTVTTLDALGALPTLSFFNPARKKRALVVLTDGESQPVSGSFSSDFAQAPRIDVTFVKVGDASERIYESGEVEAGYAPDPRAAATLEQAAALVRGRVVGEGQVAEMAGALRTVLATGPTRDRRIEGNREALMPYVAFLAILPLGFVLYRRNL